MACQTRRTVTHCYTLLHTVVDAVAGNRLTKGPSRQRTHTNTALVTSVFIIPSLKTFEAYFFGWYNCVWDDKSSCLANYFVVLNSQMGASPDDSACLLVDYSVFMNSSLYQRFQSHTRPEARNPSPQTTPQQQHRLWRERGRHYLQRLCRTKLSRGDHFLATQW